MTMMAPWIRAVKKTCPMPLGLAVPPGERSRHIDRSRWRGQSGRAAAPLLAVLALVRPCPADAQPAAHEVPCAEAAAPALEVRVLGARSDDGRVVVTLWGGDRAKFLKHHGWIARGDAPLHGHTAEVCFALPGPGIYALSLYHDENGNGHFDRTMLGMPQEGYGVSNDAPTTMGLPSFDTTRMTVGPAGGVATVHLRY